MEQPPPRSGAVSVTEALVQLLCEREERGIAQYGRSLETFNGRNAVRDLIEELIDGAQYALQWEMEREALIAERDQWRERALRAEGGG